MKAFLAFVKTTLIGGLVIVLPLWLSLLLLGKLVGHLKAIVTPISALLPAGLNSPTLLASLVLLLACFVTGWLVRTRPGRGIKTAVEHRIFERIPGYNLMRSLAVQMTGIDKNRTTQAAFVEFGDALVPAIIVERHEDGRFTVFVPSAPTPVAGSIHILPPHRVHAIDVPLIKTMRCVSQWGVGTRDLLAAAGLLKSPEKPAASSASQDESKTL
jgi:uncharacterized membrane protein